MKKHKLLLLSGLMCLSLSGCAMSPETLVEEMLTASDGKEMTQSSITMEMDMSIEADGTSMDTSLDLLMDLKASSDPYASYCRTEMTMDAAGEETTETTEVYSLEEDGALVNYIYTTSTDDWEKQDLGTTLEEMTSQTVDYNWLSEKAKADELTLAEETQTINDTEVYVLSGTINGDTMQDSFDSLGMLTDVFGSDSTAEIDFTALTVPVTYYIDTESFLPLKIEMDIEGMGDAMNSVITSLLGTTGTETELSISVDHMHIVYDNIGYDAVTIPEVPKEGLIIANQTTYNPDKGDGTYVIQEAGDAVKITLPDGWAATDMGYDTLTIQTGDQKRTVTFTMYTNIETGLAFRNYVERGDVLDFLSAGTYGSHGSSALANDYGGLWLKTTTGTNYYYAWKNIGERDFIFVKMSDSAAGFDRNTLDTILPCVEEYDLMSE